MSLTPWLGIGALTLLALWIWKSIRVLRTFTEMGIPGPRPLPILGNVLQFKTLGFPNMVADCYKKYGKLCGLFMFSTPTIVVGDLDMLKEIFVKRFTCFQDKPMRSSLNHMPYKHILTVIRGEQWRHVRKELSPTFSSSKIKRIVPNVTRLLPALNDVINTNAERNEEVELKELFGRFAMDVIAASVYSIDADALHDPESEFVRNTNYVMKPSKLLITMQIVAPRLFSLLNAHGLMQNTDHARASQFFMRVSQAASADHSGEKRQDFLQLLMEGQREGQGQTADVDAEIDHRDHLNTDSARKGLTQDEVTSSAFSFLMAGYETVSATCAFATFLLAHHRDCLQAAVREVDDVIGKGEVTYEKANALTYLDMCVSETLRFYGSCFILNRECLEDCEIMGVKFTKGVNVFIPSAAIHMDPAIWPQPDTFDPLRFTAEAKANRHPFAYMPFGLGPRNCIGMRLAQLEVRMALASVLQNFTPVLCDKTVYPPQMSKLRMEAVDGLWLKFQRRT